MADDDGNETRIGRIDLKLHLGLPPPSWHIAVAAGLGSDLALGRTAPVDMSQAPYSPTHASFDDPELRSVEALAPPIQPPGVPVEAYDSTSRFGVNDRASPLADGPYSPLAPMQLYSPRSSWSNPRSPSYEPTLRRRPIRWSPYLSPSYDPTSPPYSPLSPSVAYTRTRWTPYSTPSPFEPSSPPSSPLESSSPIYEPRSPMYLSPPQPYEPRSPPYVPPSPYEPREPPRFLNEVDSGMPNSFSGRHGEFLSQEGGYSLQLELQSPEFRFRRSGEDNYRLRRSEFRVDPADGERSNNVLPLSPFSERLSNRIMRSQREKATYRKHDTTAKGVGEEGLDAETKEKIKNAANFECNICLDMAKEAVVTSCGHLFCWSCLYQWLHLHPDHRECPVCKGEVIESNITPIYGRGGSESSAKKKLESKEESSVAIPPRPRGNRFESYRQQVRPVSSNLGEGSDDRTVLPRIRRARRIHIGRGIRETAPISRETELPTDGTPVLGRSRESNAVGDGTDSSSGGSLPLPEPEGVAAVVAGIVRMSGRHALSRLLYGAASSVNPLAPVSLAADHSSTSSTMAVIQEDTTVADESAEPNSAGSSRSRRRRRRSSASGFSDIDGEALHAHNRRRLN